MADLQGQDQGKDEVDQCEGEGRAEVDRIAMQLGADDDQPQRPEAELVTLHGQVPRR
jgi:hypothetical protein